MEISIEKINELIEKEKAFAKEINPMMALGIAQIQRTLNEYAEGLKCLRIGGYM